MLALEYAPAPAPAPAPAFDMEQQPALKDAATESKVEDTTKRTRQPTGVVLEQKQAQEKRNDYIVNSNPLRIQLKTLNMPDLKLWIDTQNGPTAWGKISRDDLLEEAKTIQNNLRTQANLKIRKQSKSKKSNEEDVPFPDYY